MTTARCRFAPSPPTLSPWPNSGAGPSRRRASSPDPMGKRDRMRPNETVWKSRVSQTHAVTRRRRPRLPAPAPEEKWPRMAQNGSLEKNSSPAPLVNPPNLRVNDLCHSAPFRSIPVYSGPFVACFSSLSAPFRHCFESPLPRLRGRVREWGPRPLSLPSFSCLTREPMPPRPPVILVPRHGNPRPIALPSFSCPTRESTPHRPRHSRARHGNPRPCCA